VVGWKAMNSITEFMFLFKKRWGTECFWGAIVGIFSCLPGPIYLARLDVIEIASFKESVSAGEMGLGVIAFLFSVFVFLTVSGFTGWLFGFYVRKAAALGKRRGDIFIGSVLYGIFIMLPFGMYAGYGMLDRFNSIVAMALKGPFSADGFIDLFSSIFRASLALAITTLIGGLLGAALGLVLNKLIISVKSVLRLTK
jgi:hypothetical protein